VIVGGGGVAMAIYPGLFFMTEAQSTCEETSFPLA